MNARVPSGVIGAGAVGGAIVSPKCIIAGAGLRRTGGVVAKRARTEAEERSSDAEALEESRRERRFMGEPAVRRRGLSEGGVVGFGDAAGFEG